MYKYETHCHTSPASRCGKASVKETVDFYVSKGYDGIFITNHFLDGNIGCNGNLSYEQQLEFYLNDYYEAKKYGENVGLKVLFAIESTYITYDFLIYGLDPEWYKNNLKIIDMPIYNKLKYIRSCGGFIVQAHPFREAYYIESFCLYPYYVDGVEVLNACDDEKINKLGNSYADTFNLLKTAGSDNHYGFKANYISGIKTQNEINSSQDYINIIKTKKFEIIFEKNLISK